MPNFPDSMATNLSSLIGFAVRMGKTLDRNWKVVSSGTRVCTHCNETRVWMYEAHSLRLGKGLATGWFSRVCLCTLETRKLDLRSGSKPAFRVYSVTGQPAQWDPIPTGSHVDALQAALFSQSGV